MDYDEHSLNSMPTMGPGRDVSTKRPPFLDEPSLGSAPTMGGRTTPPHGRFRPGDVLLGRYTVLAVLGEGGMGVVYKCLDTVGGIEVAIKCLPPELSRNESEMEGIRENYAIVSRLHHSAISGLRQLEKDPEFGEYYLVMDLAKGEDLSTILRRRHGAPMPLDEALAILRPLASALDYAHGERVLHRDVKPANVKVETLPVEASQPSQVQSSEFKVQSSGETRQSDELNCQTVKPSNRQTGIRVQLLDFGLAAEVRSSMSRESLHGHAGSSGTPAYMAPEQWEARRQSAATDQYSLAVMAYQMLSGYLPFDADNMELFKSAVLTRAPDEIEGVPAHVNAALQKALAKNPKERFASCAEFVEAISNAERQSAQRDSHTEAQRHGESISGAAKSESRIPKSAVPVIEPQPSRAHVWPWVAAALIASAAVVGVKVRNDRETDALYSIASIKQAAASLVSDAMKYSTIADAGFPQRFAAIDVTQKRLNVIVGAKNLERARSLLGEIGTAAKWITENGPKREAVSAKNAALSKLVPELEQVSASSLATGTYNEAKGAEERAKKLCASGDFDGAGKAYDEAESLFRKAIAEAERKFAEIKAENERLAREEAVREAMGAAKAAKTRGDWDACLAASRKALEWNPANADAKRLEAEAEGKLAEIKAENERLAREEAAREAMGAAEAAKTRGDWDACLAAAQKALEWNPANADAKRLKAEAEKNLAPTWVVSATVGGAAAADAKLSLGGTTYTLPATLSLEAGKTYGPGEVTLERGGKTYVGTLPQTRADWKSEKNSAVVLAERKAEVPPVGATAAGGTKSIPLGDGVTLEMVHCPGVEADFWMGKYEVTQEQWKQVTGWNPAHFASKGAKLPVESVSWNDCQKFVKKLNALPEAKASGLVFRLPMEYEWEKACRAGAPKSADYCKLRFGTQITSATLSRVARYGKGEDDGPLQVGSLEPNAWGLYDMHGNVWEWTQTALGGIRNERGGNRMICGGCYGGSADSCTAGHNSHSWEFSSYSRKFLGLRLAASGRVATEVEENGKRAGNSLGKQGEGFEAVTLSERRGSKPGEETIVPLGGGVALEMVYCPCVTADFWMGKYEVTQEQWRQVTGWNPETSGTKGAKLPVASVSWDDCQEFVEMLNALPGAKASGLVFRLPKAEDWEMACRAGAPKTADYCKLRDGTQITSATLSRVARYGKGEDDGPLRVGSLEPNAWGLYDMHGNVWEWTSSAVGGSRVYCGGSFDSSANLCTAGYRTGAYHSAPMWKLGLRLAASGGRRGGETKTVPVGSQSIVLHWCPAGSFTMGAPASEDDRSDDETLHRVRLTEGFWMGETEVTQGLWKEVMGTTVRDLCDKVDKICGEGDDYPMYFVSWENCQEFLRKLNARSPQAGFRWALPTEAQWEYACRARSTTAYFWGNALNGDKANCNGNFPSETYEKGPYEQKTTRVKSYAPNAWGLYDMHGNVWEWCQDRYGPYPAGPVTDPNGTVTASDGSNPLPSNWVRRGGSWDSHASWCRSATRSYYFSRGRLNDLGFRVALVPVQ